MVEEYLSKDQLSAFFSDGVKSAVLEKRAALPYKDAIDIVKNIWSGGKELLSGAWDVASKIPGAGLATMGAGAATGVMSAMAYDIIRDELDKENPQKKLNDELEKIYLEKERERNDSEWLRKVIAKRNDLKRNGNRMSKEEYSSKYRDLIDSLIEKRRKA